MKEKMDSKEFFKTKKYQGKILGVNLYRERLSDTDLEKLRSEFSDILIVGNCVFWFSGHETWPVERRFGFFERFQSSYITRIDQKAGRVAALRRWWHIQKTANDKRIDRDRPEIDLGGAGWDAVDTGDSGRMIETMIWCV